MAYSAGLAAIAVYSLSDFASFPTLPGSENGGEEPLVSIVVPVRNEIETIEECVRSLLGLRHDEKEIIFVDGGSVDGTLEVLERYGERLQIVREGQIPPGWTGKNWACHQGYLRAEGDLLLFTDGDTRHERGGLESAVRHLSDGDVDLLTLYPQLDMRNPWEKLLLPLIALFLYLFSGGSRVNRDDSDRWMGNGQYLLFRREAYEDVGGHKAVKGRIDEDYRLAEMVKKSGRRLSVLDGSWALSVHMYGDFGELWRGWVKNSFSGIGGLAGALAVASSVFALFLLPFLLLAIGLFSFAVGGSVTLLFWGALTSAITYGHVGGYFYGLGGDMKYLALLPISVVLYLAILVVSTTKGVLGLEVTWKGRSYTP